MIVPKGEGRYKVLDRIQISPQNRTIATGKRTEIQLCRAPDGSHVIRMAYYIRRGNPGGSLWWTISPRPLCCSIEEAKPIAEAILDLAERFQNIKDSIQASKN